MSLGSREGVPTYRRVAAFGGVYSNHLALAAAIADARSRDVDQIICLGDLGAFGPHPDKAAAILRADGIPVVRGNYDDSIARGLDDCQCGYTDARDNRYARLSYQYTYSNTSAEHRQWMGGFPSEIRFRLGDLDVLACHGSPRQTNEFLWESTTPEHFLAKLEPSTEVERSGAYVNVGALGRPANDGRTDVWYALLEASGRDLAVDFVPVSYDHALLADEMRAESLPEEFVETILTGWWTTCLEILPGKERARGRL